MIYLDNAATTFPKPNNVINAVSRSIRTSVNPGRSGYASALASGEIIYSCREKLSQIFNLADIENCILTPSCTVALNTVIQGVLKNGDHVVISSIEHNAVLRPVKALADKGVITFSIANIDFEDEDKTVDSFRKCINDKTKLVICAHASNVFGIKVPIKRLAALCKYYGVLFCIDGAQSVGLVDIDISDIGADYLCVPGHKGLYGPMGTGALIINSNIIPDSLYQGGTGTSTPDLSEPSILPDKFEAGTMNISGFAGLKNGIDFVKAKGISNICKAEMKLIRYLYDNLNTIKNVKLYTSKPDTDQYVPLLSFNIKDKDSNMVSKLLSDKYSICTRAGLHCSPLAHRHMNTETTGTVRVCTSVFTTKMEIDTLINAIFTISRGKK